MKKQLLLSLKLPMLLMALFILPSLAHSQSFSVYEYDTTAFPTIKVHVVARDALNKEILDLTKDDFSVKESGVSMDATLGYGCQKENKFPPISVTLVLDVSPSMNTQMPSGEKRFDWVKAGAKAFIDSIKLDPPSALSIIKFSGDIVAGGNSDFQTDKAVLYDYLSKAITVEGSTDFRPPFNRANPPMGAIASLKTRPDNIRRVIVFLSDGEPQRPFTDADADKIIADCKAAGIEVYGIFINNPINDLINWIAQETGGNSYRVDQKAELLDIYRKIVGQIQSSFYCSLSWTAPYGCDPSEAARTRPVEITYKRMPKTVNSSYVAPYSSISRLEVSDSKLLFGKPGDGTTTRTITVTPRVSDFNLNSFALTPDKGDFTIDWAGGKKPPITLPKDKPYTFTINYVEAQPATSHEVKLSLGTTPCSTPDISLIAPCGADAKNLNFNPTAIGTTSDIPETCILKNTTLDEINGDAQLVDPNNDFAIVTGGGPFKLAPNACLSMTIRFQPTTAGDKTATIKFNITDGCGTPIANLAGRGVNSSFPMPTLDFKEKRILTVNTDKYVITNTSAVPVTVKTINVRTSSDANFTVTLPTAPFTIAANGGKQEVNVTFTPQTEGMHENFIDLEIENLTDKVSGRITGIGTLPVLGSTAPTFAPTKTGTTSASSDLILTNTSTNSELKLKEVKFLSATSDFAFVNSTPSNLTLNRNNGKVNIPMTFTPQSSGTLTAKVLIKSDAAPGPNADPDHYDTLLVSGEGLGLDIKPATVNYQDVLTCDEKTSDIVINNTGSSSMTVSSAAIGDAVNYTSQIVDPTIAAGQKGVVRVTFHPKAKGTYITSMKVVTSNGEANIALSGNGTEMTVKPAFDETVDYTKVAPGDLVPFKFDVKMPLLNSKPVTKVDYELSYSDRMFLYDNQSTMSSSIPGWTWKVTNSAPGKLLISGQGTPITSDMTSNNTLMLRAFLTDVEKSNMILKPDFGADLPCVVEANDSMEFVLKTCYTKGRLIKFINSSYEIQSITPNPSNTDITIKFTLGFDASTRIELFNSLGSLVKTVVNETMTNGYHEINVPLTDLSSGVYTLSVQSGPFSETRQVIIIR